MPAAVCLHAHAPASNFDQHSVTASLDTGRYKALHRARKLPQRAPYLVEDSQGARNRPRMSTNRKQPPNRGENHDETEHGR
jgi:hypothetical protein